MTKADLMQLTFDLEPEEQIGQAYYNTFGRCLDYVDLSFLLCQKDPFDFSCLHHLAARKHKERQMTKLSVRYAGTLLEQLFIPSGINAEIQHLPRYIDIPAHRHEFFEIVNTLEGSCLHTIEGVKHTMSPGDVTIIPPGVQHHLLSDPQSLSLTVKIRRTTFDRTFPSLLGDSTALSAYFARALYSRSYQDSLTFHCGKDPVLFDFLLTMYIQQLRRKPYFQNVIEGLLIAFFSYLLQNYENTGTFSFKKYGVQDRMSDVENYLRQHYRDASLEAAAEYFYLSPSHLSTVFKSETGRTFSSFLQEIRMEQAVRLLTKTDLKVFQICEQVGYQDTTQFIRTFKKHFGMTPRQFRIAHLSSRQYT